MVLKNTTCLGYTSRSYAYSGNSVVLALKKSDTITAKATRRVASDMKTMSITRRYKVVFLLLHVYMYIYLWIQKWYVCLTDSLYMGIIVNLSFLNVKNPIYRTTLYLIPSSFPFVNARTLYIPGYCFLRLSHL